MSPAEQEQFVRDLSADIIGKIIENIKAGKVPADWNGVELRALLAEKFAAETTPMSRKQKKQYQNGVLVNNL